MWQPMILIFVSFPPKTLPLLRCNPHNIKFILAQIYPKTIHKQMGMVGPQLQ